MLCGDFNYLPIAGLHFFYNLKQIVKKPTRKDALLDLVLTNIGSYYKEPMILPPLETTDMNEVGESDHNAVLCMPTPGVKRKPLCIYIQKRTSSHNDKVMCAHALQQSQWELHFHLGSCIEQFKMYHTTMIRLLDEYLPLKYVKGNTQD